MAFALFYENPIIPIGVESEFFTYDDIIADLAEISSRWDRANTLTNQLHSTLQGRLILIQIQQILVLW